MTEEEKKAIKYLKNEIERVNKENDFKKIPRAIVCLSLFIDYAETLLNLIEKLQKENGELKEKKLIDRAMIEDSISKGIVERDYISKDKIREIIEKLENEEKALRKDFEKHRVQLFELHAKVVLIEGYKKLLEEE